MKRPVNRLKVSQEEELLKLMAKLLYSSSKTAYEVKYHILNQYCQDNNRQAFFAYFEKNWNSRREIHRSKNDHESYRVQLEPIKDAPRTEYKNR
ncbi:hypothetical protein F443_10451 [Phytophthora nicotianae P1569]|uniref:Uncharacterized protein n=1 Tax=Phytophthora nicotianae P1569 TaxID=1317065 RepID=V9F3I4_PHYNI|nr:hypothetical protein F443_10451 [Phytophthora nicotianae P1569]